jgi:hypothetical protein
MCTPVVSRQFVKQCLDLLAVGSANLSVNQLQVGASRACAFCCWPGCCYSQLRRIAARRLASGHSKSLLKTALLFSPNSCVPVHQQDLSLEPIHLHVSHRAGEPSGMTTWCALSLLLPQAHPLEAGEDFLDKIG